MNNLPFSSGHPALAIKEELAPNNREEMENIADNFQQVLRLCSPRLQASMDDYSINYHCSLAIQHSVFYGMSPSVDRKSKRSSSLGSACGLVAPKRSLSLPPILRELIGGKKAVTLNFASPRKDLNHGTPLFTLSNLSTPRTNFSTGDTDGSWTAGLQLVSNEDGSTPTEMSATPMEHLNAGGEMFPNTVSHSRVPTISDDFDRVPSGPLANGTMNDPASLLDNFTIVVAPHLDNSVTSIEEQRRAAKMARALEEPFEFNSQNRVMAEYEEQLTPMDNSNEFDFTSLSPTFLSASMEDTKWESSLVFQFENQVRLGVTSEASPTEPQVPELKFNGDGSSMTTMPGDHFRIPEQVEMEADTLVNAGSCPSLSIRLVNFQQPSFKDASFPDGTVDRKGTLSEDSHANASLLLNHSENSIQERRRAAKSARALETQFEYNSQNRVMAEYEELLAPIDAANGFDYDSSSPSFSMYPTEDNDWKGDLVFQFPTELQSENNRDSKPTAAESDGQRSIHARRLAARMVRQEEIANEFNGQNRVMYEYEQMEPIDFTDCIDYSCPSPVYQGSQTSELNVSSDREVPESMDFFSSLTSSSSLTEDSPYENVDNSLPDYSLPPTESSPSNDFDALTSLEEQLRFITLAKDDETGQDFFNQQRFVMEEFERNEPVDITNGVIYECSSPTFVTSSPVSDITPRLFNSQDSTDTKPTNNNQCDSCCESVKDPEHSTHPLLPSIDYSAQSLNQFGINRNERLDNVRDHVDNRFSDGWRQCAKDSGTYKKSSEMDQRYYEEVTDPTGRGVSPTGQQGKFQEPTLSCLLGSQHFSDVLVTSCSFDDEYENDDDNEVFTEFNDQHLGSTQMEGGEDERFPHSQSSGSASCTRSSSDVDVFGRAPSAIERRAMRESPGCSMEHARGMLDRRLHDEIARQLDSVDTRNQEETVMMEFEAGLGSGVCDDEDDGFSGEVEVDDNNHQEDWNDETGRVCEADISIFPQSSFVYPPDSGGR